MALSSKNSEPNHISAKALEKQGHQLKCINRLCNYGDSLNNALKLVCTYYGVDYKPGKMVCMTCFIKCLKHYKYLEIKWKEGKCIMDASFPSFDSYSVIDDPSGKEEDEAKEEEPKPSTSRADLPVDQDVKNAINCAITHFFNKNKHLIEHQVNLCEEFINEGIRQCQDGADELDKLFSNLEDEMASLRNEIFGLYQPIITSLEPVEINELDEENIEEEQEEVTVPQGKTNKLVEKVETPKQAKRLKLDKSDEDNK
ncbi:uncharacterized protein LOC132938852 [Metopolophium dirhodum]|uniref:uncharacterized protein LOC132938852 n=1 Tax=Metopolophium dirhodum TaxID=44670 RepID=UPI00298FD650|nr:uncharacterized protein LOC132938852 [Metopolophium dirhodum]